MIATVKKIFKTRLKVEGQGNTIIIGIVLPNGTTTTHTADKIGTTLFYQFSYVFENIGVATLTYNEHQKNIYIFEEDININVISLSDIAKKVWSWNGENDDNTTGRTIDDIN